MDGQAAILLVLWFFVCPLVGALIGAPKGRVAFGAFLGFFFGPVGWLIIAVCTSRFRCPMCREAVQEHAKLCAHCRQPLAWSRGEPIVPSTEASGEAGPWYGGWPNNDPLAAEPPKTAAAADSTFDDQVAAMIKNPKR